MIGVRRVALTLAVLAIVTGCGGESKPSAVASAFSSSNSSAAQAPTSTSPDASGEQFAECGEVPATMVQTVTFDFDGDGVDDRVVDVVCETPTAGAPHLLVAFVGDRRQVLVDVCVPGGPACASGVEAKQIVGDSNLTVDAEGLVQFRGRGYSPTAPLCCPDLDVRKTFRWNKTRFVEEPQ
jgi:hypothetical protein